MTMKGKPLGNFSKKFSSPSDSGPALPLRTAPPPGVGRLGISPPDLCSDVVTLHVEPAEGDTGREDGGETEAFRKLCQSGIAAAR